MKPSSLPHYQALSARDARFDGVFYVGVTSTGIYCRPICPARTPKESHCRFYDSAEMAEKEGFRPCLRCRPELAPGLAPVDDAQRIAHLILARLEANLANESAGLEAIAAQFQLSSRQIRRIVQQELGVSPIELIQTRRLLLAKQLLTETHLPITEVAFASGFASLRRFNDAFRTRYGMPPTHLRKAARRDESTHHGESSTLQLSYRPPYDWDGMLAFLQGRMLKGVEWIMADAYHRTVQLSEHTGWLRVSHAPAKYTLLVEFSHSLVPVLPQLLMRVRHLFDLSARPDLIATHLSADRRLAPLLAENPGIRVPGAFDAFELSMRAILGQQVTVKAATTLACRFVDAFGASFSTPFPALNRLSPTAARIAEASEDEIGTLGIVGARARSMIALANTLLNGTLPLDAGAKPEHVMAALTAIPGIGPWTANYIAMRALRWPDAFPKEDIAIRNALGGVTANEAETLSQRWRPWRSYAVLHLWRSLAKQVPER